MEEKTYLKVSEHMNAASASVLSAKRSLQQAIIAMTDDQNINLEFIKDMKNTLTQLSGSFYLWNFQDWQQGEQGQAPVCQIFHCKTPPAVRLTFTSGMKAYYCTHHSTFFPDETVEDREPVTFPSPSGPAPSIDLVYTELFSTYQEVREPGRHGLVIFLPAYAIHLGTDVDTLRQAIITLHDERRFAARKLSYPTHIPEAWEIDFFLDRLPDVSALKS